MEPLAAARTATLTAFVASGMLAVAWVARMPAIRDQLELSESDVGMVLMTTAAGSLASMFLVGRLAVRWGSNLVLRWSLPLMAASAVAIGFAPSFGWLFAAALVTGLLLGATDVTMNSQASLLERRTGRPILARMHAGWSFGSAMGAGLAAATAALTIAVGPTMIIAAALALAASATTSHAYLPDANPDELGSPGQRQRIRLPRAIVVVGVVMALALLIEGAVAGWSTLLLYDEFGVAAWLAALGYLVYELSMVAGRLAGDRARHRWGDRTCALAGSFLATLGLVIVLVSPAPQLAVAGLIVVGFGQSVVVPIAFATAGALSPGVAAAAIARVGGFGYAGLVAGPAAFGFVADAASMRAGFLALVVLAGVMTAAARVVGSSDFGATA